MKYTNKKGFTLVELLVAISILGLIMIIAIPQLSNVKDSNKTTQYKKYAESLLSGGKLYTDSYTEDMFGYNASGCYDIPYKDLKDKNLIKDIKVNGVNCSGTAESSTFVRVYKSNDNYNYETSIYCVDKHNKEVYKKLLSTTSCDGTRPDDSGPTINISPNSSDWTKGKNSDGNPLEVTITISDKYGMHENTKIKYTWTKTPNAITESEYTEYNFKNKHYEGVGTTKNKALEKKINVPQNKTGIYYLVVKPVDVRDANNNYTTKKKESSTFKLDNTGPSIPTSEVRQYSSSGKLLSDFNGWSNKPIWWGNFNAVDDHCGAIDHYEYSQNCTRTKTDNLKSSYTYSTTQNEMYCIRAVDKLGNKGSWSQQYQFKIDKDKPSKPTVALVKGNWKEVNNDTWYNFNIYVAGKADKNNPLPRSTDTGGSGIAKYQISKDNKNWDDWSYSYSNDLYRINKDGTHYRYIRAIDNAGNKSDVTTKTIKRDTVAPTCSVSGGKSTWINKTSSTTSRTITAKCSDTGGSGCATANFYKVYSSDINTTKAGAVDNKSGGSVKDNAGNVTNCAANQTVKIDKTPPTVPKVESITAGNTDTTIKSWKCKNNICTVITAPCKNNKTCKVDITYASSDEISGVNFEAKYETDGEGGTSGCDNWSTNDKCMNTSAGTNATYSKIWIRAVDKAGNNGQQLIIDIEWSKA